MYLFFHLLSQQSNALNFLISKFFASFKAFSLCVIPSIGTFWLLFPTNQWKTAFIYLVVEDIPFFSKEVVNLCLFFTHVERVFFGTPYFAATSLFVIPFSKSFRALHFTPIGLLFNLHFMGIIFLS